MAGILARATVGLALAGGALALALAVVVTASVLMRWLAGRVIPGDFELVQIGISLATFAFLPLCQLRGGNIVVDTFTQRLPPWLQGLLDALWAAVYAGVAGLIAWRMAAGAVETLASGTTSMVLRVPLGVPIGVAAALSAWLAAVSLATALGSARGARR